jgi:hypothetical protein
MMIASKLVTLNADGTAATVAAATMTDVLTTIISTNSAVTGVYGLVQKAGLFAGGMVFSNKRHTGEFFNWG